jgi:hypothetical protein
MHIMNVGAASLSRALTVLRLVLGVAVPFVSAEL